MVYPASFNRPKGLEGLPMLQAFSGTSSYALYAGISTYAITASYAFNQASFNTGGFVITASGALTHQTAAYAMTSAYSNVVTADGGTF
jgi:hypothetical protein